MLGDDVFYVHTVLKDQFGHYILSRHKNFQTSSIYNTDRWTITKLFRKEASSMESSLYKGLYTVFGITKPDIISKAETLILGNKAVVYTVLLNSIGKLIVDEDTQIYMIADKQLKKEIDVREMKFSPLVKHLLNIGVI